MEIKHKRRLLYNKLFRPIKSINQIEKDIMLKRFNLKYKKFKTNKTFYRYFAGKFIYKRRCHITSYLKDYLLFSSNVENIKMVFNLKESLKNLIKYSLIYKDYAKYYCFPMISNFFYNNIIVDLREAQAKLFYDIHFKKRNNDNNSSKDNGIIIYSKHKNSNENESKNEIVKFFFTQKIRKEINSYSPNKIECSKVNNEENSLFISTTNDNIISQLIKELHDKKDQKTINHNNSQSKSNANISLNRFINNNNTIYISNIKKLENQIFKNYKNNSVVSQKNNNENKNYSYNEKTHYIKNEFHKNKNNDFIKTIKLNLSKTNNNKRCINLIKNKSIININQYRLEKSYNTNKGAFNSIDLGQKIVKNKKKDGIIFSLKRKDKNHMNKRELVAKTPNTSLIVKLNKIVKINNNIFNINIIKNKNDKSMLVNPKKNYNFQLLNPNKEHKNYENISNYNKIIEQKYFKSNYLISRNKHNSKTSRNFSTKKIKDNKKILKDSSIFSLSKYKKNDYNKMSQNSIFKRFLIKPKTNENTKHLINNENFVKGLNILSINSYKTYKNNSNRISNFKRNISHKNINIKKM